MAWDLDADDIDQDEDDRKPWLPVTPQTLVAGETEWETRVAQPIMPTMPPRQMEVYTVRPIQTRSVEQVMTPIMMPVHTPQIQGKNTIKENLAKGDSPWDEEMTADEDGESELTEISTTLKAEMARGKKKMKKTGRTGVPKKAEVIVLAEPRTTPCDRCRMRNTLCMPRTKGGQPLDACAGCFRQKLSCQTGGMGGRRKFVKGKQSADSRESSESDEESDVSGKDWLARFSTMKVGPPRHIKATKGATNATATPTDTRTKLTGQRATVRAAGMAAKNRIDKLGEFIRTCA